MRHHFHSACNQIKIAHIGTDTTRNLKMLATIDLPLPCSVILEEVEGNAFLGEKMGIAIPVGVKVIPRTNDFGDFFRDDR